MPNPEHGCAGLQEIFNENIYAHTGMEWAMTAAISGAHTIGSAKKNQSGYEGYWSDEESQGFFNNDYYLSILVTGWGPELEVSPGKNQWQRVDKKAGGGSHHEMMLTTDLCMAFRNNKPFL